MKQAEHHLDHKETASAIIGTFHRIDTIRLFDIRNLLHSYQSPTCLHLSMKYQILLQD
jgi:hypothetical protein